MAYVNIQELVEPILDVYYRSAFRLFPPTISHEMISRWLSNIADHPDYYIARIPLNGPLKAFCIGRVHVSILPPFLSCVSEIMWWAAPNKKREASCALRAVERWGKLKGACLVGYTLSSPGQRTTRAQELCQWKWIGDS